MRLSWFWISGVHPQALCLWASLLPRLDLTVQWTQWGPTWLASTIEHTKISLVHWTFNFNQVSSSFVKLSSGCEIVGCSIARGCWRGSLAGIFHIKAFSKAGACCACEWNSLWGELSAHFCWSCSGMLPHAYFYWWLKSWSLCFQENMICFPKLYWQIIWMSSLTALKIGIVTQDLVQFWIEGNISVWGYIHFYHCDSLFVNRW